jgi:hypothetical protein
MSAAPGCVTLPFRRPKHRPSAPHPHRPPCCARAQLAQVSVQPAGADGAGYVYFDLAGAKRQVDAAIGLVSALVGLAAQ